MFCFHKSSHMEFEKESIFVSAVSLFRRLEYTTAGGTRCRRYRTYKYYTILVKGTGYRSVDARYYLVFRSTLCRILTEPTWRKRWRNSTRKQFSSSLPAKHSPLRWNQKKIKNFILKLSEKKNFLWKYHVCNNHSIRRLGWNWTVYLNQQLTDNMSIAWEATRVHKDAAYTYGE